MSHNPTIARHIESGRAEARPAGGYRTRGGEGHHFVTFDLAGALVADPGLRSALDTMNGLRTHRHALEYEPQDEVDRAVVEEAVNAAADARARFRKVRV